MKTRNRFLLVLLLALTLLLSFGLLAMAASGSVSCSIGSTSGYAGQTVSVTATVSGNNLTYMEGSVSGADDLAVSSVSSGWSSSGSGSSFSASNSAGGSGSVSATVYFTIPSGAAAGDSYSLSLSCSGTDTDGSAHSSSSSGSVTVEAKPVSSVKLSSSSLSLQKGESSTLTATVSPSDATDTSVSWSSSDSGVATVSGGKVTAVGKGSATITATAGSVEATCAVTVSVAATGISLDNSSITLSDGSTKQLKATVTPSDASSSDVSWSSSDSSVATVSGGLVTAVAPGSATITAKTSDGSHSATCSVTVNALAVTGVSLSSSREAMNAGDSVTLKATITPSGATNQDVTWSSSNSNIATVSGGTVTAKAVGSTTITVTTDDGGHTATCAITVEPVEVEKVNLNKVSIELVVGDSYSLEASISPSNATYKDVTWSSSNSSVAKVSSDGTVTALKAGKATITATAKDVNSSTSGAANASCNVTVTAVKVTGIAVSPGSLVLTVGDKGTVSSTVSPSNADQDVTWSTSDSSVATVSSGGTVTAKGAGKATITATASDGSTKDTCSVTVNAEKVAVSSVSINHSSVSLAVGNTAILRAVVYPSNATNQNVSWSSSNSSVASVNSSGVVTGHANGTATIYVQTSDGGKTASCSVTVQEITVTGVTLDPAKTNIYVGNKKTIRAIVAPANATNTAVTWTSSDKKIATVDKFGVVTGVKAGKATITAKTAEGGFTAKCVVTVKKKPGTAILPTGIKLDRNELELVQGDTFILIPFIEPDDATETTVLWTSSDDSVVKVNEEGVVEAVGPGIAIVAAKTMEGELTDTCEIMVLSSSDSSSNSKIIIGIFIFILLAAGGVGYYIFNKLKAKKQKEQEEEDYDIVE